MRRAWEERKRSYSGRSARLSDLTDYIAGNGGGRAGRSQPSPLLANVYLTELDEELTARGHRFVRYADDVSVYLKSPKAAERVKMSITAFLAKRLKLLVNEDKSAVDTIWRRSLLGFSFTPDLKVRIAKKALKRAKIQIKKITRRNGGRSLEQVVRQLNQTLTGWGSYFALADTPSIFVKLDKWIRRRLRCLVWKQWKRPRTRRRELAARGVRGEAERCTPDTRVEGFGACQTPRSNRPFPNLSLPITG